MGFEAGPQEAEVTPSGIGVKAAGQDFARMIISGEDEVLEAIAGPPLVWGGIVLKEFADGGRLPTAARLGAGSALGDQLGVMLLDVLRYRGTGAVEIKAVAELIGDERIIERLRQRDDLLEELFHWLRPEVLVIAAGGFGNKALAVLEPSSSESVKLRASNVQTFEGGGAIHLATVKQSEDLLDQWRADTMG